jgi:hypothetical protein
LIFTNKYWIIDGPPDPDPDKNALEITKQVAGNSPDFSTYFEFEVTVTTPAVAVGATPKSYNAYIVFSNGNYVTLDGTSNPTLKSGTSSAPAPAADYVTFISGIPGTIKLQHGERLVFFDLEVGSAVAANEVIVTGARVKYVRTFSNPGVAFLMPVGTTNTWGFPRTNDDAGPHYTIKGAGTNVATFTNTMSGNPPTGINVDNLPFILLIAVAIAGLVGFVVIRARRNAKYDA